MHHLYYGIILFSGLCAGLPEILQQLDGHSSRGGDIPPVALCSNEVSLFYDMVFPRAEYMRCPELKRSQLAVPQPRWKFVEVVKDIHHCVWK